MQKSNLKSGVDWADLRYNPVQGLCPNTSCSIYDLCYMKRPPFCWSVNKNPNLRLDEKKLMVKLPDEPNRIFVQDNLELFHERIRSEWIQRIIERTDAYPQHTFIFLTKNPARYAEFEFPKNCWLGVTVTQQSDNYRLDTLIEDKREHNLLFVSCEPLLGPIWFGWPHWEYISWFIAGALTGSKARQHPVEKRWIDYMKFGCRNWEKPLFLKNNLRSIWDDDLIQEWPKPRT